MLKAASIVDLKTEFALLFNAMAFLGWDELSFGHNSMRIGPDEFLINRDGVPFNLVNPTDILKIDSEGRCLEDGKPASFALHKYLHRASPENVIVLHTHYSPCVAMANLDHLTYNSQFEGMLGPVAFRSFPNSGLQKDHFQTVLEPGNTQKVLLCQQHGAFVFGSQFHETFFRLFLVCRAAETLAAAKYPLKTFPKFDLPWPAEEQVKNFWNRMREQISEQPNNSTSFKSKRGA